MYVSPRVAPARAPWACRGEARYLLGKIARSWSQGGMGNPSRGRIPACDERMCLLPGARLPIVWPQLRARPHCQRALRFRVGGECALVASTCCLVRSPGGKNARKVWSSPRSP